MPKESKGVIYILTNPSFEEYVKIGYADDLAKRLKQLNKSETIPFAFRAYATYDVNHRLTDKELHNLIDSLNPDLRSVETFNGKTRTLGQPRQEELLEKLGSVMSEDEMKELFMDLSPFNYEHRILDGELDPTS